MAAASKASILSNLEPFIAMIMGVLLLQKPITGHEIIGSLFIVGGVMFLPLPQHRSRNVCGINTAALLGSRNAFHKKTNIILE
ncbi:EamA family transporter [Lentibacillus sp. CBA3610]|uniref:EamA family transporter n=1 Tax=Lentibacillus sp. CBA3610 TaxID=2518176 RepID=UPI001594F776|nr:hypothetical protein Len3610_19365 [Lentibacillus sp. CBA3610]